MCGRTGATMRPPAEHDHLVWDANYANAEVGASLDNLARNLDAAQITVDTLASLGDNVSDKTAQLQAQRDQLAVDRRDHLARQARVQAVTPMGWDL